jgi:diguanylate cyclase (GGDEF)-like protein
MEIIENLKTNVFEFKLFKLIQGYVNRNFFFKFVVIFFIFTQTSAQQLPFARLSIEDGLEDTVIFSIEQDNQGFLWISTRTGINRFDGERFWTYNQDKGLPHNLARDMHKTKDGTLWVASERGVAWFDGDKFQTLEGWPENISARALSEAADGTLWVATYGAGIIQIELGQSPKILKTYDFKSGLPSDRIRSIFVDNTGLLWLGFSNKIVRIAHDKIETIPWKGQQSEIRAFYQHTDDKIWVATRHGVAHFTGSEFKSLDLNFDFSNQTINSIMLDNEKNVWLGTRDFGVYQISPDLQITHLDMKDGLPDNSVNEIFQDDENNMWFGTYGGGIARLSTSKVLNWKAQANLSNPNVYTIADDNNGCVWFGTNGNGVTRICDEKLTHFSRKDGLPHNKILSIVIDKKGDPWFGTLEGVSHYVNGEFINYGEKDGLSGTVAYQIIQAQDGTFWIGTNNGLNHFDGEEFIFFNQKHGLPNNRINRILESNNQGLWIASANGLTRYVGGSFINWSTNDGLPANFINDFYEDEQGGLWIATNNGLSYFYQNKFTNWTKDDGLPHNNSTAILPGKKNEVWIGTSRGVALFDGEHFTVITSREGLVFDLINRGAGYRDLVGNLWFGTGEGASRFSTDYKLGISDPPPVLLLSVSNNQQSLVLDEVAEIHQQGSSMHFDYSAISFKRAPDVNYRYRLANNDQEKWRETRLRALQIDSLEAGDYQFEITARIGQGKWNETPAIFKFTVIPPFWRTLWFMGLVLISVLGVFFYRIHRSKQHAIKLENTVKQRTEELEKVNKGLEWLANHDSLTRLANRHQVQLTLTQLQKNQPQLKLGLIIIDLDYFKSINDNYGHAAGDIVLQEFSKMLKDLIDKDQMASRWGGEEFLIVCPNTDSEKLERLVLQILDACMNLEFAIDTEDAVQLRCSIGFTNMPTGLTEMPWERVIQLADMALYSAKHNGRNRGVGYIWKNKIPNNWDFNKVISEINQAFDQEILTKIIVKK